MHKLSLYLIVAIVLFCTTSSYCQKPANGLYISLSNGIFPVYGILTVTKDSSFLEAFTILNEEWVPIVGNSEKDYKAQVLKLSPTTGKLTNGNVSVFIKNFKIKGTAMRSFVGRTRFKFMPVDESPDNFKKVKESAMNFVQRDKKYPEK